MLERAMNELLVVVDMQRLVAEDTPWRIDGVRDLLPKIEALADAYAPSVMFTRYVLPVDQAAGTWRRFTEAWSGLLREPELWELVPELASRESVVAVKSVYSCFGTTELQAATVGPETPELVLCGVETDCCVLATVLEAVDKGIRVTVVEDAVLSPSATGHAGALALCRRLPEQVSVTTAAELLAARQRRR